MSSAYAVLSRRGRSRACPAQNPGGGHRQHTRERMRGLTTLEIVALALILAALVSGVLATRAHPLTATSSQRVSVVRGDTLWSIARAHPIPGQTTAQTADAIARLSSLHSSEVQVGDARLVPAAQDSIALAAR